MVDNEPETDEKRGTEVFRHDYEEVRPSVAIIETVSAVTNRKATELPLLHDVIDPEALDSLFDAEARTDDAVETSFRYAGLEVVLHAGRKLEIRITEGI